MKAAERAALEEERRQCDAKIDAAYWRFSRSLSPSVKPPVLVVPEAYARRTEITALLNAEHKAQRARKGMK